MREPSPVEPKHLRLFLAVDLDDHVRDAVTAGAHELKKLLSAQEKKRKWSWVPSQNYHVTLKLLGAVEEGRVSEIGLRTKEALSGLHSFDFEVKEVGAFPRALWLGISDPAASLTKISEKISEALVPAGFEREDRSYVPHLTLGRLKEGRPLQLTHEIPENWRRKSFGTVRAREVILFKSETFSTGPVYTALEKLALIDH